MVVLAWIKRGLHQGLTNLQDLDPEVANIAFFPILVRDSQPALLAWTG